MAWAVEFSDDARRQLKKLDGAARQAIITYLEKRVVPAVDPKSFGHALRYDLTGLWRYRVADWRLICEIDPARHRIRVKTIGHRREVYD